MGQPVAWTEPFVMMLLDVRGAHFHSAAQIKGFVHAPCRSMHGQEQSWTFSSEACMIAETLE